MVVLLGVLAAQAMADWAEERRLGHEAPAQLQQVRRQAIEVARALHFWNTVGETEMAVLGVAREEWQQLDFGDARIDDCGLISNWR